MDPFVAITLGVLGGIVLSLLLLAVLRPREAVGAAAVRGGEPDDDVTQMLAVKNRRRREKGLAEISEREFRASVGELA